MSDRTHSRLALVTDDAVGASGFTRDGRTGALHMSAPLTWSGVREYPALRVNGRAARILRRPEQITRPGYLETCARIPPTHGHPQDGAGQKVMIDPDNYKLYAVGSVGDKIEIKTIEGYPVPVATITVNDAAAIAAIEAGDDQVSQGFFALIAPPPRNEAKESAGETVGIWKGPHGPEEYDVEHVCDPDHPAAIEYEKRNPDFPREKVGANHIAVGIPKGRGLAQAQARPVDGFDDAPIGGAIMFLDESTPAMPKQKHNWSLRLPAAAKAMNLGAIPFLDEFPVEVEDSPELMVFLQGLQEFAAGMIEKLSAAEVAVETAQGEVAAATGEAAAAVGEAAAATTVAEQAATDKVAAVQAVDALTIERDALLAEVKPLRVAALDTEKARAAKMSPGVGLDACEDIAAVRRAAVVAKDPSFEKSSDGEIAGAWRFLSKGSFDAAPSTGDGPSKPFMKPTGDGGPTPNAAAALFGKVNG